MAGVDLVAIGISLAVSAISYGIQALLAPKPPPIVGPRLDDLGAPTTNPGKQIPFAVGQNIAPGQIIWSTGLVETEHVEKVSGGKGGGSSQKIKTYTYSTSLALAFNDGEICGVQRIIAGGSKVIWSAKIGETLTEAEINALVDARYDEVYAEQETYWGGQTDPATGGSRYTTGQVGDLSDANAQNEADKLRAELEAQNEDIQPRYSQIEFFDGTETQQPSSIIESVEGAGNVSAFRGTAYVVIQDLELADFGNFVPPIAIHYATEGEVAATADVTTGSGEGTDSGTGAGWYFIDYSRSRIYTPISGGGTVYSPETLMHEYDLATLEELDTHDLTILTGDGGGAMELRGFDPVTGYLYGWHSHNPPGPDTFNMRCYVYDPATKTVVTNVNFVDADYPNHPIDFINQHYPIIRSPDGNHAAVISSELDTNAVGTAHVAVSFPDLTFHTQLSVPEPGTVEGSPSRPKWQVATINSENGGTASDAWAAWVSFGRIRFYKYSLTNSDTITTTVYSDILASTFHPTRSFNKLPVDWCPFVDSADGNIVLMLNMGIADGAVQATVVFKWNPTTEAIVWQAEWPDTTFNEQVSRQNVRLNGGLWRIYVGPDVYTLDLETGDIATEVNITDAEEAVIFSDSDTWDGQDRCFYHVMLDGATFNRFRKFCFQGACLADPITLTDVITDYMTRAGFAATEFTVDSALDSETIWGFNDNAGRSSRDILEDLARIRPIIVNEVEGKIKFRLADQATVATIPKEDVRAYDGQGDPPAWISEIQTLEDLALPKTLRITYQDIDRALNPTTAIFTREVTQSRTVSEFSVQAVDDAQAMRNSVFTAMSVLMSSKRTFKLSVPLKYMVIEPGDVVVIPVSDTRTARARVIECVLGANNIVEMELSLYIDTSLGIVHTDQFEFTETDTAPVVTNAELYLLDVPYLTDSAELNDAGAEDYGIYAAVGSLSTGFPGANLYVNATDLQTTETFGTVTQATGAPEWTLAGQFTVPTQAGRIVQLPDLNATGLVQDTVSELIVAFRTAGASFTSISDAQMPLSQENAFVVGDEIIQAQTVELIGASTYLFTNLYRGLQGTEWAIGTQAVGDDVIYLDSGALQRIDLENADLIGLDVDFRAVTVGSDVTIADTTTLAFTGASRKPYAPTISDVIRAEDGAITFTLNPRNRYGSLWTPATPAFESDPQDFEVDVYSGATVVRTLTISDAYEITYTAAQQVTDFGGTQASVTVRPYQLNAAGDRGFTNEEAI